MPRPVPLRRPESAPTEPGPGGPGRSLGNRRSEAALRVLQSVPEPRPTTNPYVVQLIAGLRSAGVEVLPFGWRAALTGRYDVFHVHWPENLLRGSSRSRTWLRRAATLALLLRLRARRTPIVRTLHNLGRHESAGAVEGWLLGLLDRWTGYAVAINPVTEAPPGVPTVVVPHGHYRETYAPYPRPEPVPGRLAYFGLIRPYKGVEQLLTAFRELPGEGLTLTVSGRPRTPELADELRRLAAGDDRITLELDFLSDQQLAARVGEAELVVLPYRQMHNSGAALAALSLDRPVLVPASEVNRRLAEEVGPGWLLDFEGELTAEVLRAAIQRLDTSARGASPDLSRREWSDAGAAHAAAYRDAVRLARAPRVSRA